MKRFLSTSEVADILHVTPDFVNALARAGLIPAYRLKRLWRFDHDEIERWIKERRWPPDGSGATGEGDSEAWLKQQLEGLGDPPGQDKVDRQDPENGHDTEGGSDHEV